MFCCYDVINHFISTIILIPVSVCINLMTYQHLADVKKISMKPLKPDTDFLALKAYSKLHTFGCLLIFRDTMVNSSIFAHRWLIKTTQQFNSGLRQRTAWFSPSILCFHNIPRSHDIGWIILARMIPLFLSSSFLHTKLMREGASTKSSPNCQHSKNYIGKNLGLTDLRFVLFLVLEQ